MSRAGSPPRRLDRPDSPAAAAGHDGRARTGKLVRRHIAYGHDATGFQRRYRTPGPRPPPRCEPAANHPMPAASGGPSSVVGVLSSPLPSLVHSHPAMSERTVSVGSASPTADETGSATVTDSVATGRGTVYGPEVLSPPKPEPARRRLRGPVPFAGQRERLCREVDRGAHPAQAEDSRVLSPPAGQQCCPGGPTSSSTGSRTRTSRHGSRT